MRRGRRSLMGEGLTRAIHGAHPAGARTTAFTGLFFAFGKTVPRSLPVLLRSRVPIGFLPIGRTLRPAAARGLIHRPLAECTKPARGGLCTFWRRGRDSNPRYGSTPYTHFPGEPVQPLRHLSRNLIVASGRPAAARRSVGITRPVLGLALRVRFPLRGKSHEKLLPAIFSNPRYGSTPYTHFPGEPVQPLRHLSRKSFELYAFRLQAARRPPREGRAF